MLLFCTRAHSCKWTRAHCPNILPHISFCLCVHAGNSHARFLHGISVFVTPGVLPAPATLRSIIECAGGKMLNEAPGTPGPDVLVVTCPADERAAARLHRSGHLLHSPEVVLTGVLKQQLLTKQSVARAECIRCCSSVMHSSQLREAPTDAGRSFVLCWSTDSASAMAKETSAGAPRRCERTEPGWSLLLVVQAPDIVPASFSKKTKAKPKRTYVFFALA